MTPLRPMTQLARNIASSWLSMNVSRRCEVASASPNAGACLQLPNSGSSPMPSPRHLEARIGDRPNSDALAAIALTSAAAAAAAADAAASSAHRSTSDRRHRLLAVVVVSHSKSSLI